jgi:hypothetical protein
MSDAPKPAEIDPRDLTSFSEAGGLAERFEGVLRENYKINIAKGSDLEAVSLDLMLMEGYRRGEVRPDPMTDIRPMLGRAAGWIDFVQRFPLNLSCERKTICNMLFTNLLWQQTRSSYCTLSMLLVL